MSSFKVVIPSAGVGSRVGPYTKFMNKALITLGGRPAIVRIIETFEADVELVILLGYKGHHVRQVLKAFFPDRTFNFVKVDNFEGPGSGLGYSLSKARHVLNCPFIFISNDTIISEPERMLDPSRYGNWLGYYKKKTGDGVAIDQYRTIETSEGFLVDIFPKGVNSDEVYIGLCGVEEHELFWRLMEDEQSIEVGESLAVKSLHNVKAIEFDNWSDIGSVSGVEKAKSKFQLSDINILEKENEAIWFSKNHVLKFHIDENFIAERVKRLEFIHNDLTPGLVGWDQNIYWYEFIAGSVLSKEMSNANALRVLDYCQEHLWSKIGVKQTMNFDQKDCVDRFYKDKTYDRVRHFLSRFEVVDEAMTINGVFCPPVFELLGDIRWDRFTEFCVFANFHGDFHPENIVLSDDAIKVLDWRQNFGLAGLQFGDVYYDLAKFLHGLIVSHEKIASGRFSVTQGSHGTVNIDVERPFVNVEAERAFRDWCEKNGYEFQFVELITALIYLNICSLHEYPYSKFLFFLGRYLLQVQRNSDSKQDSLFQSA